MVQSDKHILKSVKRVATVPLNFGIPSFRESFLGLCRVIWGKSQSINREEELFKSDLVQPVLERRERGNEGERD